MEDPATTLSKINSKSDDASPSSVNDGIIALFGSISFFKSQYLEPTILIKSVTKARRKRNDDMLVGLVASTKRMKLNEVEGRDSEVNIDEKMEVQAIKCSDGLEYEYFFDGDGDSSWDEYDYESDSNNEDHYKNEYPDESERCIQDGVAIENESTSSEDDDFGNS